MDASKQFSPYQNLTSANWYLLYESCMETYGCFKNQSHSSSHGHCLSSLSWRSFSMRTHWHPFPPPMHLKVAQNWRHDQRHPDIPGSSQVPCWWYTILTSLGLAFSCSVDVNFIWSHGFSPTVSRDFRLHPKRFHAHLIWLEKLKTKFFFLRPSEPRIRGQLMLGVWHIDAFAAPKHRVQPVRCL